MVKLGDYPLRDKVLGVVESRCSRRLGHPSITGGGGPNPALPTGVNSPEIAAVCTIKPMDFDSYQVLIKFKINYITENYRGNGFNFYRYNYVCAKVKF